MASEREPGFYWVRLRSDGPWQVAQYFDSGTFIAWWLFGVPQAVNGDHLAEIGERIPDHA